MHILIGLLTAVAGLIWALYRLQNSGVDLNSFNPFYWMRRRRWEQQLGAKAMHRLSNPLDAAALLVVASAKVGGDVTRELKQEIAERFQKEFQITEKQASELYLASAYLLNEAGHLPSEVRNVLAPTRSSYRPDQVASLLSMMEDVANAEGSPSETQLELLNAVEKELKLTESPAPEWK